MHNLQLRVQAYGAGPLRDSGYSNSQDGEKLLGPNDLEQARTVPLRTALGVAPLVLTGSSQATGYSHSLRVPRALAGGRSSLKSLLADLLWPPASLSPRLCGGICAVVVSM